MSGVDRIPKGPVNLSTHLKVFHSKRLGKHYKVNFIIKMRPSRHTWGKAADSIELFLSSISSSYNSNKIIH